MAFSVTIHSVMKPAAILTMAKKTMRSLVEDFSLIFREHSLQLGGCICNFVQFPCKFSRPVRAVVAVSASSPDFFPYLCIGKYRFCTIHVTKTGTTLISSQEGMGWDSAIYRQADIAIRQI